MLEGAESAGAEIELIDLGEIAVAYCVACGVCHKTGSCTQVDEFDPVRRNC